MTEGRSDAPCPPAARRLAAIMLAGGSLHFLAPRWFDAIIPRSLPGRARTYTYVSGSAALAIGAGLTIARTRRLSADLATAFFVGVMPAKVRLAADWCRSDTASGPIKLLGIAQLFWQIPLITEAIKVRRAAG